MSQPCPNSGTVYVHSGPISGEMHAGDADVVHTSTGTYDSFGARNRELGDLDGDGYEDMGIAETMRANGDAWDAGALHIWHGPHDASLTTDHADAAIVAERNYQYLGYVVDSLGDLDGDGSSDFVMGSENHQTDDDGGYYSYDAEGGAFAFYGPISGTRAVSSADYSVTGSLDGDGVGSAVAAGDLDADGVPDFAVGGAAIDRVGIVFGADL